MANTTESPTAKASAPSAATVNIPGADANRIDPARRALGMIETKGLVACIEAADTMVKSAGVTLLERRAIGGGYVTVMVRGDVGAVRTALEAGAQAARRIGEVVAVRILPGPHLDLEALLPKALDS